MTTEQFIKGKSQILTEYMRTRKKLGGAVAGRGFSFEPGFMYDAQNELEFDVKTQLSELNYKILEEAYARELKQYNLDYNLAYKNAMIAWEIEKQELLTDWDRELADLKQAEAREDDLIRVLALEVAARSTTLIEAKTAITLEIEALQLQMAELEGTTGPYEVQLAQAKILTAQKKLEVIPYIEQIIEIERQIIDRNLQLIDKETILLEKADSILTKENELLEKNQEVLNKQNEVIAEDANLLEVEGRLITAEQEKITELEALIDAEETVVQLRQTTISPILTALIAKMEEYITELAVQQALYDEISATKIEIAGIKEEQASKQNLINEKRRDLSETVDELITLKETFIDYRNDALGEAVQSLIAVSNEYIDGALYDQIDLKTQIAAVKTQIAELESQKVDGELDVDAAQLEVETQNVLLSAAQIAIDSQRSTATVERATLENSNLIEVSTTVAEIQTEIQTKRAETFTAIDQAVKDEAAERLDIDVSNKLTDGVNQRTHIAELRNENTSFMTQSTELELANSTVTARLNHLLSQD